MQPKNQNKTPSAVWVAGGLGNQLFQIAFGIQLQNSGEDVVYDTSWYHNKHNGLSKRNLDVESIIGQISKVEYSSKEQKNFHDVGYYMFRLSGGRIISPSSYIQEAMFYRVPHKQPAYYQGYWQTNNFYEKSIPELRQRYCSLNQITQGGYACLHIRRSDYTRPENTGIFHTLEFDYYASAIKIIQDEFGTKIPIHVLSDDELWAKNMITSFSCSQLNLLPHHHSAIDLFRLMTGARSLIIANSTFSFWGAQLNPFSPLIIAPNKWFKNKHFDLPSQWKIT